MFHFAAERQDDMAKYAMHCVCTIWCRQILPLIILVVFDSNAAVYICVFSYKSLQILALFILWEILYFSFISCFHTK